MAMNFRNIDHGIIAHDVQFEIDIFHQEVIPAVGKGKPSVTDIDEITKNIPIIDYCAAVQAESFMSSSAGATVVHVVLLPYRLDR
jgi:hypothetical protein